MTAYDNRTITMSVHQPIFWFLSYYTHYVKQFKTFTTPYILERAAAADKLRIGRAKNINLSSCNSNILYIIKNSIHPENIINAKYMAKMLTLCGSLE
mgnify:FL=1